ncbi:lysozyme inhibitor LprI family protein [Leptobacterium sp. I13]|uniref:lysozyme inhibitor LprI family protein n=1 Tax=Leptobacterium meishanense TaxID=3128904 RepID=UPI0030EE9A23
MKCPLFFLFCFSTLQTVVSQEVQLHAIDIQNQKCHENSIPTTQAAIACETVAVEAWEQALYAYHKLLSDELSATGQKILNDTQKQWEAYFKEELAFYGMYYNELYEGGTLMRLALITKKKELLKARAVQLKNDYEAVLDE